MLRRCHKGSLFAERIHRALGVDVRPVQCHIVDEAGMAAAMHKVGWAKNESNGVVGFQVGEQIYVRNDSTWTTLHELIHRSGVNADRINRFIAEGLVEVIAARLAKAKDEHRPTYPEETAWVKTRLLPKLGLNAIELGRKIVESSDPPRMLAELLVAKDPSLDRRALIDAFKAQRPGRPNIGSRSTLGGAACGCGSRDIAPPTSDWTGAGEGLVAVFAVAGLALGLPVVLRSMERAWGDSR
jgi:hypothetical protein